MYYMDLYNVLYDWLIILFQSHHTVLNVFQDWLTAMFTTTFLGRHCTPGLFALSSISRPWIYSTWRCVSWFLVRDSLLLSSTAKLVRGHVSAKLCVCVCVCAYWMLGYTCICQLTQKFVLNPPWKRIQHEIESQIEKTLMLRLLCHSVQIFYSTLVQDVIVHYEYMCWSAKTFRFTSVH